jgi:hypothetical protein
MQIIVCGLDHMHAMLGHSTLLLVELRFGQGHQGRVQQAHESKHERKRCTHERTRVAESLHGNNRKKDTAARPQRGGNVMLFSGNFLLQAGTEGRSQFSFS